MKRIKEALSLLILLLIMTGCEGFKVLTIYNSSISDARVTVRPGIASFDRSQIHNFPNNHLADSSVFILRPDSSMTILSIFTSMLFNVKIKEDELRIDFLKIESPSGTTIAHSREEIIDLIYSKRKGQIKGEGRNFALIKIE